MNHHSHHNSVTTEKHYYVQSVVKISHFHNSEPHLSCRSEFCLEESNLLIYLRDGLNKNRKFAIIVQFTSTHLSLVKLGAHLVVTVHN